jgi:hypothetical protein
MDRNALGVASEKAMEIGRHTREREREGLMR